MAQTNLWLLPVESIVSESCRPCFVKACWSRRRLKGDAHQDTQNWETHSSRVDLRHLPVLIASHVMTFLYSHLHNIVFPLDCLSVVTLAALGRSFIRDHSRHVHRPMYRGVPLSLCLKLSV